MNRKFLIILLLFCTALTIKAQEKKVWSLADCLQHAIENNVTVQKSGLDKQTAQLNYQQQKNNKLPSVAANVNGSLSNGSVIDAVTNDFIDQQIFSNNLAVNAQATLYQGNTLNLNIQKNEILLKQSELYLEEAKNNITLSVLEYYLQALYYHEAIGIAENAIQSSEKELAQTQKKFDNGAIARLELAEMETQHSNNQYTYISNKNLYDQQVLSLKQLLELDPTVEFEIENISLDEIQVSIPNKEEVFAKASDFLPDLKIYDLTKESLEKDVKIAKAGYLPTVSLTAGLNSGYTNTMNYVYTEQLKNNFNQQIGFSISIPIFSKSQNKTNIKLANIQLKQNDLDKVSASKTLYSKIETIYQNTIANLSQQNALKTAKDNAQLAYDLASKKYEFGGLTPTELAVSRNAYLNAEQSYLQSKYLSSLYQKLLTFYQGESVTE